MRSPVFCLFVIYVSFLVMFYVGFKCSMLCACSMLLIKYLHFSCEEYITIYINISISIFIYILHLINKKNILLSSIYSRAKTRRKLKKKINKIWKTSLKVKCLFTAWGCLITLLKYACLSGCQTSYKIAWSHYSNFLFFWNSFFHTSSSSNFII